MAFLEVANIKKSVNTWKAKIIVLWPQKTDHPDHAILLTHTITVARQNAQTQFSATKPKDFDANDSKKTPTPTQFLGTHDGPRNDLGELKVLMLFASV